GRMDYDPSSKDAVTFSIYWTPVENHSFNGQRVQDYYNHFSTADAVSGIYTHTFTPTLLNEARFGFSGWYWNEITSNPQLAFGLPDANITNGGVSFAAFGPPGPSVFNQKTYNGRDILTKVQGSHYLKFGADISRALFLDTAPWGAIPTYNFRNLWDFANDAPYTESTNFNPVTGTPTSATKNERFNILAFFVEDDWKVKPNLTLNLGLRYEYFSPLTETNGNISNVILGPDGNALADLSIHKGNPLFRTSKNNWGPQIGFAWTPKGFMGRDLNSKFVVRGGFGIGQNLQQVAITSNGRFNPPFLTSFTLSAPNILYATGSNVHDINSYPSNPATIQTFGPNGLPTSGAPVSLTGFPSFVPSTVTYRYSLDTQYDLGHNWVASLGYQGSQSRHLGYQNFLNLTLYPESNPKVQSVDWYSNVANSSFNALLAELQHHFSSSFEFDFQYRFSRDIDEGSQDYFTDNYPWNLSYAKGPSDFDVTHNVKLYGIWSPKIFTGGHSWLEKVVGGWTFTSIITAHTGFPWTPEYCNTNGNLVYPGSNSGTECLYPAAYSGGAATDYSNATFMSPNGDFPKGALAYFTVPTFPTLGIPPPPAASIHRNEFRGPGYFGTDMVLAKAFGLPKMKLLGEGAKLNLQISAYNVFNKLNLYQPGGENGNSTTLISNDGVTSNPQFGTSPGAFAGRIVELQARFSF
ncbi:MAG: TonB-dependent receptor, partial [Bryobacteraceae bacterium]